MSVCGGTSSIGALVLSHPEAVNPPGSSQLRFSLAYAGLGLAALTAALITLATYHYIRRANRALPRASRLPALERLLRTTAETNALTFVVVLANVAVLAASVGFWLAAINEMVPVVYTISLLVSVLSRTHGREGGTGVGVGVRGSEEERAVAARQRVRDAAWVPNSPAERRESLFTLVGLASKGSKTEEATADQPTTPASPLTHIPLIKPGAPHAVSIALSALRPAAQPAACAKKTGTLTTADVLWHAGRSARRVVASVADCPCPRTPPLLLRCRALSRGAKARGAVRLPQRPEAGC